MNGLPMAIPNDIDAQCKMDGSHLYGSWSAAPTEPKSTAVLTNITPHNTKTSLLISSRKYKIAENAVYDAPLPLPVAILAFGIHRVDVGIERPDGAIDADSLYFVHAQRKISALDIGLLVLTEGASGVVTTAVKAAQFAESLRGKLDFVVKQIQSRAKPDTADWAKWKRFDKDEASFRSPQQLIGFGRSLCAAGKVSVVPNWLTIGLERKSFDWYGAASKFDVLSNFVDWLDPFIVMAPEPPGLAEPIAATVSWGGIFKSPAVTNVVATFTRDSTKMLEIELSDLIGDLSIDSGIGVWLSRELVVKFIMQLSELVRQVGERMLKNFDEFLERIHAKPVPDSVHKVEVVGQRVLVTDVVVSRRGWVVKEVKASQTIYSADGIITLENR